MATFEEYLKSQSDPLSSLSSSIYPKSQPTPEQKLSNILNQAGMSNALSGQVARSNAGISTSPISSSKSVRKPASQIFAKGQITNSSGNYSKSNIAKSLGISTSELERRVKAGGYKSSLDYYNATKNNKASSNLNPFVASSVYAQDGSVPTTSTTGFTSGLNTGYTGGGGGGGGGIGTTSGYLSGGVEPSGSPLVATGFGGSTPLTLTDYGQQRLSDYQTAGVDPATIKDGTGFTRVPLGTSTTPPSAPPLPTTSYNTNTGLSTSSITPANLGGNASVGDILGGQEDATQQLTDVERQRINDLYDNTRASYEAQIPQYQSDLQQALAQNEAQKAELLSNVNKGRSNAEEQTGAASNDALSMAQQAERRTRNTLRALGILGSSAAGELLSKPWQAYDQERASLQKALVQRHNELDDFYNQKTNELSSQAMGLQNNYRNLIDNIRKDIRFSEAQRRTSIEAANAALSQRMADLKMQAFTLQQQTQAQKQDLLAKMAQIASYTNPTLSQNYLNQVLNTR